MTKLSLTVGLLIVLGIIGWFGAIGGYTVNGVNFKDRYDNADPHKRYEQTTLVTGELVVIEYNHVQVKRQDMFGNYVLEWANPSDDIPDFWQPIKQYTLDEFKDLKKANLWDALTYLYNLSTVQIDGVPDWMAYGFDIVIVVFVILIWVFIRG